MTRHLHIDRPVGKRHPQVLYPDQLGERVDLVDLLAAEWAQKEVGRHSPLSRFAPSLKKSRPIGFDRGRVVKAFCLAVAVFNIVYFGGQLLRAFL